LIKITYYFYFLNYIYISIYKNIYIYLYIYIYFFFFLYINNHPKVDIIDAHILLGLALHSSHKSVQGIEIINKALVSNFINKIKII